MRPELTPPLQAWIGLEEEGPNGLMAERMDGKRFEYKHSKAGEHYILVESRLGTTVRAYGK